MDKSKKSRSLSLSLSSSPKLKTRHYKTTIFWQNSKTKQTKTQKRGFMIHSFLFLIFFPLRIQSLRNVDSSQILKVGREEKRKALHTSNCVLSLGDHGNKAPSVKRFVFLSSFLLIMAKFGAQSVSFFPSSRFGIGQILYT
jgi:hypothetical protein